MVTFSADAHGIAKKHMKINKINHLFIFSPPFYIVFKNELIKFFIDINLFYYRLLLLIFLLLIINSLFYYYITLKLFI